MKNKAGVLLITLCLSFYTTPAGFVYADPPSDVNYGKDHEKDPPGPDKFDIVEHIESTPGHQRNDNFPEIPDTVLDKINQQSLPEFSSQEMFNFSFIPIAQEGIPPQLQDLSPEAVAASFAEMDVTQYASQGFAACNHRDCLVDNLMEQIRQHPKKENMEEVTEQVKIFYTGLNQQGIQPLNTTTSVITHEGLVKVYDEGSPQAVFVKPGEIVQMTALDEKIALSKDFMTAPVDSREVALPHERLLKEIPEPDFNGGIIEKVSGNATKMLSGEGEAIAVVEGDKLSEHTSLHTGEGATVEIALYNHGKLVARVNLDENTHILLAQLEKLGSSQTTTTRLDEALGKVTIEAEKLEDDSQFSVVTPTGTASVRGTVFSVIVHENE